MKLAVTDIRISAFNTLCATIDVEVEHGKSIYSACTMEVSLPLVDGKAIKDYDEDLKNKAREVITGMYKGIVCSGETGEAGGPLDCLCGKIEPSEFSCKVKLAINDGATDKDLEERVALLEKHLEKAGAHTSGVNQEHDGSLVVRDTDGSVRVRMNAERQTDSAINIKVGFPKMGATIDKMEMKNKPDNGEERDFYGLDISYKKTLNSDIVIRGLVDVEKNSEEPTIHLLYSEDYDEQSSFSDFYSRAEKYARDVYRKIKASD
ncbi:hypothetical protein LD891_25395 [Salmonella enterica]|nr:hypothetical protein [Salmonella enterica]